MGAWKRCVSFRSSFSDNIVGYDWMPINQNGFMCFPGMKIRNLCSTTISRYISLGPEVSEKLRKVGFG